jgi:hypothetical protein
MIIDPSVLPAGLPEPEDDGAASHLAGRPMPALALPSTSGGKLRVDLVPEGADRLLLYAYPRTGRPGEPPLTPDWDLIPGARGCTPESCAFRDHAADLGMRARPWPGSRRSRQRTSLKWSRGWVCPFRF